MRCCRRPPPCRARSAERSRVAVRLDRIGAACIVEAWRCGSRERRQRARVAHHRAAHQVAQPLAVGRLAWLARHHVDRAELLLRPEDARLQQGQQVVELQQAVLHRRRRQQQQEAFLQAVDQPLAGARLVAQVVRLVDHDHVVVQAGEQFGVLLAPCRGDRGDHRVSVPEACRVGAQQRVVAGGEVDAELARPSRRATARRARQA